MNICGSIAQCGTRYRAPILKRPRNNCRAAAKKCCAGTPKSLGPWERDQVEIEKKDQLISAHSKKFAPAASGKNELNAQTTGKPPGVSLLITQAQRSQLRELGFADDRIRGMTPAEAHQILGIAS
jgi:hypothetical protein